MTTYVGGSDGGGRRVAIVAARFNEVVTGKLVDFKRPSAPPPKT